MNQREANDLARRAASLAYRIRSSEPDPAKWKPFIAAADPDLRLLVREYLTQAYRAMQDRQRRAEHGIKSAAGDAAIATIGKLL